MKIIHVPFCFYPDAVGGTEVYVEALALEQLQRGHAVLIAAPAAESSRYRVDGLAVRRFATGPSADLYALYGQGDNTARRAFAQLLDDEQPDVVHLHAFTRTVSASLARDVQQRRIPLVFTYHTPTVSCQRGTLLQWGQQVCDGVLDVHACAGCTLHGLGVSRPASAVLGSLPVVVGEIIGRLGLTGGAWTAVRMTDLVRRQHAAFRSFIGSADRVIVLCQWVRGLLIRNGVPPEKLVLSRHGLRVSALPRDSGVPRHRPSEQPPLRVVFLGRLHRTKGLDILVRAMRLLPDAHLELHVYGVVQDAPSHAYQRAMQALAADDPRIVFHSPVQGDAVAQLLVEYDVVAVPSRWLETGPLVVLEAFAAGRPVIGSRLGGIAELVESGVNGLLVEPQSITEWSRALSRLAQDANLLRQLTAGVSPPRRIQAVADEMLATYRELLVGV